MWNGVASDVALQFQDQPTNVRQWKDFQQVSVAGTPSDGSKGLDFSLAIVGVCKEPKKTVGLGDSISASGLLHHRFEHLQK